jgi:hypothetical protein
MLPTIEVALFWLVVITAFALLYRKLTRSKAVGRVAHDLIELPDDGEDVIEAYDEAIQAAEVRITEDELEATKRLARAEALRSRLKR